MKPNDEENPICGFGLTKSALGQRNIDIPDGEPWTEVSTGDVTLKDIQKGNIQFEQDGIFTIDDKGKKHQVFLYKRRYHLEQFGKPRYHVCKCQTILDFVNSGRFKLDYRRANTEEVTVKDWDDNDKEKVISDLPLCKYCLSTLVQNKITIQKSTTSSEFVALLKEAYKAQAPKDVKVDIFGYTMDWQKVSQEFREKKNYTCECCGLHIENQFHQAYIHVHHKNGDKVDNSPENLQCLCIRCHSRVDDAHKQNFTTGANKAILEQFELDYPEKGKKQEAQDFDLPF